VYRGGKKKRYRLLVAFCGCAIDGLCVFPFRFSCGMAVGRCCPPLGGNEDVHPSVYTSHSPAPFLPPQGLCQRVYGCVGAVVCCSAVWIPQGLCPRPDVYLESKHHNDCRKSSVGERSWELSLWVYARSEGLY